MNKYTECNPYFTLYFFNYHIDPEVSDSDGWDEQHQEEFLESGSDYTALAIECEVSSTDAESFSTATNINHSDSSNSNQQMDIMMIEEALESVSSDAGSSGGDEFIEPNNAENTFEYPITEYLNG